MIPIFLTIQAFGPYKETQKIDFSKFFGSRLFLITGKTGSGKTMIFDAICYALFGEASGQDRKVDTFKSQFSNKEVISCVEFEFSHRNKKYIVMREPEQIKISRGKEVKHRPSAKIIFDNEVITGVKNVNQIIMDILGIDYLQFKQIVMIAQGEFRKLVSADSKDREAIYRRIFNTMNFENIQNVLKENSLELDKKVNVLNEKINGLLDSIQTIKPISYDELSIEQILEVLDKEICTYNSQINQIIKDKEFYKKEIDHYNDLFNKFKELINFEKCFKDIDVPKLKEESTYLSKVGKTFLIRDKENVLDNLKNTYKEFVDEKNNLDNRLKVYLEYLNKYRKDLEENEVNNVKMNELNNRIIKLQDLENLIDEKIKYETDILNEKSKIEEFNLYKKDIFEKITKFENERTQILQFEFENKDISLKISNIRDKINNLNLLKDYFENYSNSLKNYNESSLRHKELEPKYNEIFELCNRKNRELIENEEIYLRNQAGILAKNLVDNYPCIVCGSTIHPNKAKLFNDNIDETFIKNLKSEIEKLEIQKNSINEKAISLKNEVSNRKTDVIEKYEQLNKADIQKEFVKFPIFNIEHDFLDKIELILSNLLLEQDKANQIYEKILKSKDYIIEIEKKLKDSQIENENIDKNISKIEANIIANSSILNEKANVLLEYDIRSKQDYIDIVTSTKKEYENLYKTNETLHNRFQKCNDEILKLQAQIDIKNNDIIKLKHEIDLKEVEFLKSIKENQFLDFKEYCSFKLSEKEFNERNLFLENKRVEYRNLEQNIFKLKNELKDLDFKSINEFESKISILKSELTKIESNEKDYFNRVSPLESVRKSITSINNEILNFDEYKINLNELNKISNGNNKYKISFERYILGIYFREIIAAANIRFSKLTNGRFLFRHLKENFDLRIQQGLDISVFDNYTSSERRINTLSGGESFKASLSLALGLSDVVQRYSGGISIDTLFIDEGFGSLDSDSLQNALECLVDVNDKSKLIGIISHVQELKDFIKSKIEVITSPTGSKINVVE